VWAEGSRLVAGNEGGSSSLVSGNLDGGFIRIGLGSCPAVPANDAASPSPVPSSSSSATELSGAALLVAAALGASAGHIFSSVPKILFELQLGFIW